MINEFRTTVKTIISKASEVDVMIETIGTLVLFEHPADPHQVWTPHDFESCQKQSIAKHGAHLNTIVVDIENSLKVRTQVIVVC